MGWHCEDKHRVFYGELAEQLSEVSEKGDFSYLFDCYEKFAQLLEIKSTLGIRIREAYLKNDKDKLTDIIKDMENLDTRISDFHLAYQKAWFAENKPQGFEIMDIRLGGLKQRVFSCKKRLQQYLEGEITEIPELREPVLKKTNGGFWSRLVSAGRISMGL